MILIHLSTQTEEQAIEISDYLVSENLLLDATILQGNIRRKGASGKIVSESQFLVLGKTKALLFNQIDREVRKLTGPNIPSLYSTPIVNMDWDLSEELIQNTEKV